MYVCICAFFYLVVQNFDLLQYADYVHCMAYDSNGKTLLYVSVL